MFRHLWLIFSQTATICLGVWFVVATVKPDWLARVPGGASLPAPATSPANPPAPHAAADSVPAPEGARQATSYSEAARRAMPEVVNIFTSKEVKLPQHPFMSDPLFRHFFGKDRDERGRSEARRSNSLGSGVIVSAQGYVLTNYHVIESADEIEVLLSDNRKAQA